MTGAPLPARGFTLIEVMVVVLIVGIMLGFASLSLGVAASPAETEAKRLAALARLAGEEAVLNNEELALRFTREGYRFQRLGDGGWEDLQDDLAFRARRFEAPLVVEGEIDGEPVSYAEAPPSLYFLSSGELTPFRLVVSEDRPGARRYVLVGEVNGEVRYLGAEEASP